MRDLKPVAAKGLVAALQVLCGDLAQHVTELLKSETSRASRLQLTSAVREALEVTRAGEILIHLITQSPSDACCSQATHTFCEGLCGQSILLLRLLQDDKSNHSLSAVVAKLQTAWRVKQELGKQGVADDRAWEQHMVELEQHASAYQVRTCCFNGLMV